MSTLYELKTKLKGLGLPIGGNKDDLISRLNAYHISYVRYGSEKLVRGFDQKMHIPRSQPSQPSTTGSIAKPLISKVPILKVPILPTVSQSSPSTLVTLDPKSQSNRQLLQLYDDMSLKNYQDPVCIELSKRSHSYPILPNWTEMSIDDIDQIITLSGNEYHRMSAIHTYGVKTGAVLPPVPISSVTINNYIYIDKCQIVSSETKNYLQMYNTDRHNTEVQEELKKRCLEYPEAPHEFVDPIDHIHKKVNCPEVSDAEKLSHLKTWLIRTNQVEVSPPSIAPV